MYQYRATCERVIDGDTAVFMIDLGLRIYRRESCRLLDVSAPEMRQPGGVFCRDKLKELLIGTGINGEHVLTTHKPGDLRQEKYGRWLVFIPLVNDAMRAFIAAKPWGAA